MCFGESGLVVDVIVIRVYVAISSFLPSCVKGMRATMVYCKCFTVKISYSSLFLS